MSQVTLLSSWALLLCACAERRRPSCHFFFFRFRCQPEMPPDAGHDKRESAPATIPVCHVFPAPKPPCPAFTRRGNGRQDRLEANAAGGTPATASHARMTMTATGLPSRRQESRASPCPLHRPFHFPRGALRHPTHFLLFLSASPRVWPMFPCRHSRRHQVSFSLQGQR